MVTCFNLRKPRFRLILPKFSIHFREFLLSHMLRSVKYFDFLVGILNGSSIDFQWEDGRHKMWVCDPEVWSSSQGGI